MRGARRSARQKDRQITGRSPAVQGHYGGYANTDAALGENCWVTMHNLPGKMAGIYRSGNHAQAKALFIFRYGPLAYDHRDIEEHNHLISDAFAGETTWRTKELGTARHGAGRPGLLLRRAQPGPDGLLVFAPTETYYANSFLPDGTRSGSAG